jgi:CRP-like cAMP-binding protein
MVSLGDLRKIYLIQSLSDTQLEKILPYVEEKNFKPKEVIFEQNENVSDFFMLLKGNVLLKIDISPTVTISLGAVKPGYSFGWSSILGGSYTSQAFCAEPCQVMAIHGEKFRDILDSDHDMGYEVLFGVVRILESRLERRTEQLLKTMRKQMEIWDLW